MSILGPYLTGQGPITRAIADVGVGGLLSALSAAKYAIQQNAADVNILIIGDSTGDEAHASVAAGGKWPYRFAQWLTAQHATHSVSFRHWNDAGSNYSAATYTATGSGGNTIRIWNASIGGSQATHVMGSKFAAAITAAAPNLVIFNHGHNGTEALGAEAVEGQWIAAVEMVQLAFPGVPVAAFLQNPQRDTSDYELRYLRWLGIAADKRDLTLINAYGRFIAAGKASSLYADNVHPSYAGQTLMLGALTDAWQASLSMPVMSAAWLGSTATNLLTNGDFSDWPGAVPVGWTASGSPTLAKDAVVVDGASAYSLKITAGAAAGAVYQDLSGAQLDALKGLEISLAVRHRRDSAAAANTFTAARAQLQFTGLNNKSLYPHVGPDDAWIWSFMRAVVPLDATLIRVRLWANTTTGAGLFGHYDRAILVAGGIPRDMA